MGRRRSAFVPLLKGGGFPYLCTEAVANEAERGTGLREREKATAFVSVFSFLFVGPCVLPYIHTCIHTSSPPQNTACIQPEANRSHLRHTRLNNPTKTIPIGRPASLVVHLYLELPTSHTFPPKERRGEEREQTRCFLLLLLIFQFSSTAARVARPASSPGCHHHTTLGSDARGSKREGGRDKKPALSSLPSPARDKIKKSTPLSSKSEPGRQPKEWLLDNDPPCTALHAHARTHASGTAAESIDQHCCFLLYVSDV